MPLPTDHKVCEVVFVNEGTYDDASKIISIPNSDYTPDNRGIGWVFYDSMKKYSSDVAQIEASTKTEDLYKDLLQRSVRLAVALQKRGIQYGDVISICTYNHLNSCTPVLAGLFLGAPVAGIDECSSMEDAAYLLMQIKPKVVFVVSDALSMVETSLKEISSGAETVVFDESSDHTTFSDLLDLVTEKELEEFRPELARKLTDTAMIFFTSGSTGTPKPICHNHISMLYQFNNLINTKYGWKFTLEYTSPYWTVFSSFFGPTTMLGGTRIIYREFDPLLAWDFAKYKTSVMFLSITEALIMSKIGRPKHLSLTHLKYVIISGNYLSKTQLKTLNNLFFEAHVIYAYGQSEIPGGLTMFKPAIANELNLQLSKITSVGTGFPGISYKILNKDEKLLGPNEKGELRVKTIYPLGGLYQLDSTDIFDRDGWLKTGDMAYYDESECFYIVGRIKDMFKYRCFRIIPSTIESVILSHYAVMDAVVFGIPHEIDGEHPMGVVILKNNCKNVLGTDIQKYVESKVHYSHALRAGVKIVDYFIKTSSGKVKKHLMRDLALQGKL